MLIELALSWRIASRICSIICNHHATDLLAHSLRSFPLPPMWGCHPILDILLYSMHSTVYCNDFCTIIPSLTEYIPVFPVKGLDDGGERGWILDTHPHSSSSSSSSSLAFVHLLGEVTPCLYCKWYWPWPSSIYTCLAAFTIIGSTCQVTKRTVWLVICDMGNTYFVSQVVTVMNLSNVPGNSWCSW